MSRIGAAAAGGEAVERVEDAAVERHQADQQQIGKGDAGELDRERKAARVLAEAGRQQIDHPGRESKRRREQHDLHRQQQREDAIGEQPRRIRAARAADPRIGRHEGGVERALGEDRAEMVRQPQRHKERVGHRPGAQHGRQHDVAQEAGHARQQRNSTNCQDAIDHAYWPSLLTAEFDSRAGGDSLAIAGGFLE